MRFYLISHVSTKVKSNHESSDGSKSLSGGCKASTAYRDLKGAVTPGETNVQALYSSNIVTNKTQQHKNTSDKTLCALRHFFFPGREGARRQ